jgi:hypothetical protein
MIGAMEDENVLVRIHANTGHLSQYIAVGKDWPSMNHSIARTYCKTLRKTIMKQAI